MQLQCKLGHRFEVDPMFVTGLTKCQHEGCTESVHASQSEPLTKGDVLLGLAFVVSIGMGIVGLIGVRDDSPLLSIGSGALILPFVIAAIRTRPAPEDDPSAGKWMKLLGKMGCLGVALIGWGILLILRAAR